MAIKKIAVVNFVAGENDNSILPVETIVGSDIASARFRKIADALREEQVKAKPAGKKLSPKVDDFLFAHAIIMHAGEAALINQDTGEPLLNKNGEPVSGKFVEAKDSKGRNTVRWESPDGVLLYRNGNGDIFPEEDLIKAHKEWIGKPLCRDHVSSTVDGIRGIIIDTYYDSKFKRVHALFALDRKNYADLARKVEAGYATSVSMGTAVGRSICSECSNVATTEAEYCHHVRTKECHGEVNKDLSPIELSIVVTGADPKAKIMMVLAALNDYENRVNNVAEGKEDPSVLKTIMSGLNSMAEGLEQGPIMTEEVAVNKIVSELNLFKDKDVSEENRALAEKFLRKTLKEAGTSIEQLAPDNRKKVLEAAQSAAIELEEKNQLLTKRLEELLQEPKSTGLDIQPGTVDREGVPTNEMVDSSGYSLMDPSLAPGGLGQAPINTISSLYINGNEKQIIEANLADKIAGLKQQIEELERIQNNSEESIMSFADLMKKPLTRKAYWQGTEEPKPGQQQYPLMGDQDKIRDNDDKHMNQGGSLGGSDGLVPGDEQAKKLIQRAELEQRMARRAQLLREAQGKSLVETKDGPKVFDGTKGDYDAKDGNKVAAKKGKDKDKEDEDEDEDEKDEDKKSDKKSKKDDDKEDKKDSKKSKKDDEDEDEDKDDEKSKKDSKKKNEKKAYWQGTEEPKPGQQQYPLMGDQDKIREKDDKQMLQDGSLGGADGMVPGDEQTKKDLQRMAGKIAAKLYKGASANKSRWEFSQNGKKLFSVTASDAYGKFLNDKFTQDSTYSDLFHSKDWGSRVMKMLRNDGLSVTAKELGVELRKTAAEPAMPMPETAPDPGAEAMPAMPEAAPMGEGDKTAEEKLEDVSRLVEQIEATLEEVKSLSGTQATPEEEGLGAVDVSVGDEALAAGDEVAPVVAKVTDRDLLQVFALLNDTCNELSFIKVKASEGRVPKGFYAVAQQAVHDAKVAHSESRKVVEQYAKQVKVAILKARAAKRDRIVAKAMGEEHFTSLAPAQEMLALDPEDEEFIKEKVESILGDHEDELHGDEDGHVHDEHCGHDVLIDLTEEAMDLGGDLTELDGDPTELDMDCGDDMADMEYDSMDAMARKSWRENLVKEAMNFDNDVYLEQRKGGGDKIGDYDLSVKDDLDKVEVLHETHEKMEQIATKPLGKVREAAKLLDKWMKVAKINTSNLDMLVAEGAVDAEVAKYWKEYYSQADAGKEFAAGLVQDFGGKTATAGNEEVEIRIRRAYSLGLEAQKKGIVGPGSADLERYVDTLKGMPEAVFNNFKDHVAQYKVPHGLTAAPLVGISNREASLDKVASVENTLNPTYDNLSKLFG